MGPRTVTSLVAAVALAGCGGGDAGGEGDGEVETTSATYKVGFDLCSTETPAEISTHYRTETRDPRLTAKRVGELLAAGSPADEAMLERGCLDGFEKAGVIE